MSKYRNNTRDNSVMNVDACQYCQDRENCANCKVMMGFTFDQSQKGRKKGKKDRRRDYDDDRWN